MPIATPITAIPKFSKIPADVLLSKEYGAERRKQITERASQDFLPGKINGKIGQHPSETEMAHVKIDDELMAHDTTCVDAIDNDGMMFSATPSGAWLPSVIAGDTGIPLTERAQSFVLIPGQSERARRRQAAARDAEPDARDAIADGRPYMALSTPGGDNQDQALIQIFFDVVEFDMNAQNAMEAPRFQTRHLVSSFDNHAWNRGDLILDERIPPATVADLADARPPHQHRIRATNNGAAPVLIKVLPSGSDRSGRGSVLQPFRARLVTLPLFDPPPSFRSRRAGRAPARAWREDNIWIGTSSWKYEGWLDQIYTRERYLSRGKFLARSALKPSAWPNTPKHFPSSAAISLFINFRRRSTGRSCSRPRRASLRFALESAGRSHLRGVSEACPLRAARGTEE